MTTMREGSAFPDLGAITTDPETIDSPPHSSQESQPPVVLVGRLVSLRFVLGRPSPTAQGLAELCCSGPRGRIGISPGRTAAVTTHKRPFTLPKLREPTHRWAMANDIALLQTSAVGQRAADLLGEPSLSPSKLLGKAPGTAASDNVLVLNVSGPSKAEAVRRANALAKAFLGFRAERLQQQTAERRQGTATARSVRWRSR